MDRKERFTKFEKTCRNAKTSPPDIETMYEWLADGVAEATDGCRVEPDGVCPHGCNSWIVELGLI